MGRAHRKRTPAVRLAAGILALLGAMAAAAPAAAQPGGAIALLPFENVSGQVDAPRLIMPQVGAALGRLGYRVIAPEDLDPVLSRHRIRITSQLGPGQLAALRQEAGATLVVIGAVALYSDSPDNPQWGLVARLLSADGGAILWAGTAGLTGDDFTLPLGLGTIRSPVELGERTVAALLRDFPKPGEPAPVYRERRPLLTRAARALYRSPTLGTAPPRRVAVLPFENLSGRKGAARIVGDVFTAALVRQGRFTVVEPGAVTDALRAIGAAPYGAIDLDTVARLHERLDADAIVLGTVLTYSEGLRQLATSPEVEFDARMLELPTGRILWAAERSRRGEDSQVVLRFGTIRAMVTLVAGAARSLLDTL